MRLNPNILTAESKSNDKSSQKINPRSAKSRFLFFFPPSFEDNSLRQSGYAKSGQKKFPNARNVTTLQGSVALPGWLAQCSPTTSWTLCKELTELRSRNPSSALLLLKEDSALSCLSGMNSANPIFHLTWVERTTFFFFPFKMQC